MREENSFSLRITAAGADVDASEVEELALQLRQDLLASGAPRVERDTEGPAPAGTRSAELIVAGISLLVGGVSFGADAAQLADFVKRWRAEQPSRRRVDVAVVAPPAAAVPRSGRRSALLVANGAYRDRGLSRLRSPTVDVRALAEVLGEPDIGGFEVETLADADEAVVRRRVAAFFADRAPDDVLVLHFSCHGLKDQRGRLHLAAADTELDSLAATALPASFVSERMSESESRSVLLVLDCCYSGAFARDLSPRADRTVHVAEEFQGGGTGRTVLTASSATEYSFESGGLTSYEVRPSFFTEALVNGLRTGEADLDHDGDIAADELFEYASRRVRDAQAGQVPRRWNFNVTGPLVVARSVRPALLPDEIRVDLGSGRTVLRLEAVKELAKLLYGSREGYRRAAHAALLHLSDHDDSHEVRTAAQSALGTTRRPTPARPPVTTPLPATPLPATPPPPTAQPPARAVQATPGRRRGVRSRVLAAGLVVALAGTAGLVWQLRRPDGGPSNAKPVFGSSTGSQAFDHDGPVETASLSPDGEWLIALSQAPSQSATHPARLWNISTKQSVATFNVDGESAFSPAGTMVATSVFTGQRDVATVDNQPLGLFTGGDTLVEVRETATGRKLATIPGHQGGARVLFSPDNKTLATASTMAGDEDYDAPIRLWNPGGKLLATLPGHRNGIQSMVFSADGRTLVSSAAGGVTKIWDVATRKNTATLTKAWFPLWLSPDGKTLANGPSGQAFQLRAMPSGKLTATVKDDGEFAGFTPDSSAYLTEADGRIRLWNRTFRDTRMTLSGRVRTPVVFSKDGRTVAAVSEEGTTKLWDATTGEITATLTGHTGTVTDMTFSPDGQTLFTTGTDATVRQWYVHN